MKSKFTWCNSSSASSCMLFQVRSQWCIYGTSARLIQGAPDHPWSPSAPPLLLHIPQNLGVQVDLFKSNPAATTNPVIIYLLSPGVTNLGPSPKKHVFRRLSWDIAVILWGTLWLSAMYYHKTSAIKTQSRSMGNVYHLVGWGSGYGTIWIFWNNLCCWIKYAVFLEL